MPLLAFVAAVLAINARLHEQATEARLVDLARVLALAVDRDLRAAEAALHVLAQSPVLDAGDLRGLHQQAAEIGRRHGGWIVVRDRHNRQIVNTARSYGVDLPSGAAPETLELAVRTRASYVSDLYVGAVLQRPVIAVGVPVVRNGEVRFVLDMGLLPERLAGLLEGPQREPAWTVTVFDRKGVVIAGVPDAGLVGSPAPAELVTVIRDDREGWVRSTTFGNAAAYVAFARVPRAEWTVAIGIPGAAAYAEVKRSLYAIVAAAAVVLTLGVFLAAVVGRRIAAPLVTLAAAARTGAAEEEVSVASAIAEVQDLEKALREGTVSRAREERERRQRVAEETRRAEAEAASRMKDEFLATLSHELRTPLNAIAAWSGLLRTGRLDADGTARALDMIDRGIQAQSMLVRDLLDVSRIIRGDLELRVQRTDVSAIVAAACEALRPSADAAGIMCEYLVDPDIEAACDADRLQQVVWNLVTNALKFTPAGGRVEVRLERASPEHARLIVRDTGRGIAREALSQVFERFQQLDPGGDTRARGLGIGLAIVKHLVERHGGTVTAESEGPGRGATFTVLLPLSGVPPPSDAQERRPETS
jgi:signal transduction histidine kinase